MPALPIKEFAPGDKHVPATAFGALVAFVGLHDKNFVVTNADALEAFLLGLVVLEAAMRAAPAHFKWRTETYEFVDNPIAIDLLCGSNEARVGLMSRIPPRTLVSGWLPERLAWEQRRANALIYPRG